MSLRKNSGLAYLDPSAKGYGDKNDTSRDKTNRFVDSSAELVASTIGWKYDYKRPTQKDELKNN